MNSARVAHVSIMAEASDRPTPQHARVSGPEVIVVGLFRCIVGTIAIFLAIISAPAQTVVHLSDLPHSPTAFGTAAAAQRIFFNTNGVIGQIRILTAGSASADFPSNSIGADFIDAGTGTCSVGGSSLGCGVDVIFKPTAPGRRIGAVVLEDANNQVLGSQLIDGLATGALPVLRSGEINTLAGNGDSFYRGDYKPAITAPIYIPKGVVTDAAGNLFLSDSGNNRVRKVGVADQMIYPVAGNGSPGSSGDGGLAISAGLSGPAGLAIDGAGNLYIADSGNHAIRRVDAITGVMSTVAGIRQSPGYTGDGGLATQAQLNAPNAIAFDSENNLYIADRGNNVIRRVDASTQFISTFAGTTRGYYGDGGLAINARLDTPLDVAFGPDGSLYIAELGSNVIRRVNPAGFISTVAGSNVGAYSGDNGPATSASLSGPDAIKVDPAGNLYIADSANNRIRRVDAKSSIITTVAGKDSSAAEGDGYDANTAGLSGPYALFLDSQANLFIADQFHNRIRRVLSNTAVLVYPVMKVGKLSTEQGVVLENDGNADLVQSNIEYAQSSLDPNVTTCNSTTLAAGENCLLAIVFAPTTTGNPVNGTLTYNSNGSNAPDVIKLSGQVLTVEPSTVTLQYYTGPNPAAVGQTVNLIATVASQAAAQTGTVSFYDGGQFLGTAALSTTTTTPYGTPATLPVTTLALGPHTITAKYSGDDNNAASQSDPYTENILQSTQIALTSSLNPSSVLQTVTFTATIAGKNSAITSGTIKFYDNGTLLGSGAIGSNSQASYSTSTLSAGSHPIYATFDANTVSSSSKSNTITQTVGHAGTVTLLSANPGTATLGDAIAFMATVSSATGPIPTGTVTFKSGSLLLGSGIVDENGAVTVSSSALPAGSNQRVTASYLGDGSDAASSSSVSVTVNRIGTVTTLTSSGSPANAGSPLPLSVTITPVAGRQPVGAINGTVTLYDQGKLLGSSPVSNGMATFAASGLTVGAHSFTADYGGNTSYSPSDSVALPQEIRQAQSNTALALSAVSTIAGKPLTLTASVTTSGVKATQSVTFYDGSNVIGQGILNNQATTSITVMTLPVGVHTVTAVYGGDGNYAASTSPAYSETTRIGSTRLTIASSSKAITVGSALTLSGVLTSDGVLPVGTSISLLDNGNVISTLTPNVSGAITFTSSSLNVGSHTFLATYAGDANNAAAQSQPQTVVVQQAGSTTTLTSSQTPSVIGTPVVLHATVSSSVAKLTGTIRFLDRGTLLGSVPVSAAGDASISISTLTTGSHTISAVYSGDENHMGSSSALFTQQVVQPTSITLQSGSNPSVAGVPVNLSAQLVLNGITAGNSSLAPTGLVTILDGTTTLTTLTVSGAGVLNFSATSLAVGTHTLTAIYSGDANFQASTSSILMQIVRDADTTALLQVSSNAITYGNTLSLTAVLKGTGSSITGPVVFHDGNAPIGQAALGANGTVTITSSTLTPGIHSLSVSYAGDKNNEASVSPIVTVQVKQAGQLTLASSSNPALTLSPVTLTASMMTSVAPVATGSIQFHEGSVLLGTVALNAKGLATLQVGPFAAGTHTLTANYAGDASDYAVSSIPLPLQVQLRPTSNALTATAPSSASGGVLSLISVLQWSGPVTPTGVTTFRANGAVIGTSQLDTAGVATLNIAAGTLPATVTASYGGDSVYAASDSAQVQFPINDATSFTLSLNPSSVSMQTKRYVVGTLSIHSLSGFSDSLSLGCLGLPQAATCTFDKDQITLAADGTTAVNVTIDTGSPLTSGGHASVKEGPLGRNQLALCCLPGSAFCAFLLLRTRRNRKVYSLLFLLLLSIVILPVSGCGSLTINSTPPGSYTFQISAAGQKSGVTISQPVPMTVKP